MHSSANRYLPSNINQVLREMFLQQMFPVAHPSPHHGVHKPSCACLPGSNTPLYADCRQTSVSCVSTRSPFVHPSVRIATLARRSAWSGDDLFTSRTSLCKTGGCSIAPEDACTSAMQSCVGPRPSVCACTRSRPLQPARTRLRLGLGSGSRLGLRSGSVPVPGVVHVSRCGRGDD